nr:hypothetical protein [Tanacetum cinerariifolium]
MNFETISSQVVIERGGSVSSHQWAAPAREKGNKISLITEFVVQEGGKNSLMNFKTRSSQVVIERVGFFFKPPAGCPCERKGKQNQLDHRVWYILVLDSRSDFIEPSKVIMRIVLFDSKKLVRSHHVDETMLEIELLSKNRRDYDCFYIPFSGCTEHFSHSTIISHRIYGSKMFFKMKVLNLLFRTSTNSTFWGRIHRGSWIGSLITGEF